MPCAANKPARAFPRAKSVSPLATSLGTHDARIAESGWHLASPLMYSWLFLS